jgi:hypothetical protein
MSRFMIKNSLIIGGKFTGEVGLKEREETRQVGSGARTAE